MKTIRVRDIFMLTKKINGEVLYATDPFRSFTHRDIERLAEMASDSQTGRIRVCFHRSPEDVLHEMLIATRHDAAYAPHMHMKSETSYYVCLGAMTLFLLDNRGKITNERLLSTTITNGSVVYARAEPRIYRHIRIESKVCVFLESRLGPFIPEDTVFAPFHFSESRGLLEEQP